MRARSFLQVSLGILALVASYSLGARNATAQAPGNGVVSAFAGGGAPIPMIGGVVTEGGDVYVTADWATWTRTGNVFTGAPTPAHTTTFGAIKARYRRPPGV
jgi:hypothetical protein